LTPLPSFGLGLKRIDLFTNKAAMLGLHRAIFKITLPTEVIDLRNLEKPKGKREGVCLQTNSRHLGFASGYFQNNIAY
jgi:hypothetical protein